MNELIARLASVFVEPRAAHDPARDAARDRRAYACAAVAVLGDARAARAGASVAAALARAGRAPCAVACVWGASHAGLALPPLPAAAAAAAKLRARGHDARAAGRLVSVVLPGDESQAIAECARVCAAVSARRDVPTVLALCAARGEVIEASLGDQDLALVVAPAAADPLLAAVAVRRLSEQHPGLRVAHTQLGAGSRFSPPPRAAVRAVLEGLR